MATAVEIPCCICGIMILPNAANQCSSCLAQQVDLKGILRRGPGGGDLVLHQCRKCRSFEQNPGSGRFQNVELESPQLMTICLKHIPALAHTNNNAFHSSSTASSNTASITSLSLLDAIFVWTEPNSRRVRLRLTVRTEVCNVRIQQRCVVEFIVQWKQCSDCNREYTNRQWQGIVQLRQRRSGAVGGGNDDPTIHRNGGLSMIEMAIARNATIRKHVIHVDACKQGFDFYFLGLSEAHQFSQYLARVAPLKIKTTLKLVSTNAQSNSANIKHTVTCDMVPLCRDDLVLVHKLAKGGPMTGRLALVTKMSSVVHWVDASPPRRADGTIANVVGELSPETYYKSGAEKMYKVLSSSKRLIRFIVLDVEPCCQGRSATTPVSEIVPSSSSKNNDNMHQDSRHGAEKKYALADVQVVRESDFGINDDSLYCVTHIGNLLQVGDVVLGYDLTSSVMSGGMEWSILEDECLNSSFVMPDVVLVKKVHGHAVTDKDDGPQKGAGRAKSGRAKKREKRNNREEKRARELEKAAGRMGLLGEQPESLDKEQFDEELMDDPEFAEDLLAAELAFAECEDKEIDPSDPSDTKLLQNEANDQVRADEEDDANCLAYDIDNAAV